MFGLREAFLGAVIKQLDLTTFVEEYSKKMLDIEIEAVTCEARIRVETAQVEARAKTQMTLDKCEAAQAEARLRVEEITRKTIISVPRRSTEATTAAPTRQRKKTVVIDTWQNVNELRHMDSPFCDEELEALKRLPSHFEYDAYRAAGIPDNAVPRTPDQAKEWYDLACRENLKYGPSSFFPPFRNPENL